MPALSSPGSAHSIDESATGIQIAQLSCHKKATFLLSGFSVGGFLAPGDHPTVIGLSRYPRNGYVTLTRSGLSHLQRSCVFFAVRH